MCLPGFIWFCIEGAWQSFPCDLELHCGTDHILCALAVVTEPGLGTAISSGYLGALCTTCYRDTHYTLKLLYELWHSGED